MAKFIDVPFSERDTAWLRNTISRETTKLAEYISKTFKGDQSTVDLDNLCSRLFKLESEYWKRDDHKELKYDIYIAQQSFIAPQEVKIVGEVTIVTKGIRLQAGDIIRHYCDDNSDLNTWNILFSGKKVSEMQKVFSLRDYHDRNILWYIKEPYLRQSRKNYLKQIQALMCGPKIKNTMNRAKA